MESSAISTNIVSFMIKVIIGFVILVVFHLVANYAKNKIQKMGMKLRKKDKEHSITSYFLTGVITYIAIMCIGFVIMMQSLGFQITSVIAILSTIGIAIGLSLQGILNDIASGILLAFTQIYNIGDVIEFENRQGRVVDFGIVNTILNDINTNDIFIVPNRKIQENVVVNFTKNKMTYIIVDVLISNTEKRDFNYILQLVHNDLRMNRDAYKAYMPKHPLKVGVINMNSYGTVLRIKIPADSNCIPDCNLRFQTRIRNLLAENNIELVKFGIIA